MSALNVDCRVIWCETQRFLVQKGGLEVFLGVTGGIRVAKRPPLFANSTIEDDARHAYSPLNLGTKRVTGPSVGAMFTTA
jgi:hypothetical protein